jgi:enterobactin synthetase component D
MGIEEMSLEPGILIMYGPIAGLAQPSPFFAEANAVLGAAPKRKAEFFAGRNLARLALERMHAPVVALARKEDRSPEWPRDIVGSIAHNEDKVAVAVARESACAGLGIDLEKRGRVDGDLQSIIGAPGDDSRLDPTALFVAKEAVFKAVNPTWKEFVDFSEVSIVSSDLRRGFSARPKRGLLSHAAIRAGRGTFLEIGDLILACFWVVPPSDIVAGDTKKEAVPWP